MNPSPAKSSEHDHGLPAVRPRQWRLRLLAASFLTAFILGVVGNEQYHHGPAGEASLANSVYHTVQLFLLHTPHFDAPVPWALELARWLAAVTTGMTLWQIGRRMLHEESGALKLRRLRGHTIVCGLGRKGLEVVRRLRSRGDDVVVLDKDPPEELVRTCRSIGAHVLIGDATNPDALRGSGVAHADAVFAVLADDGANCEVAARIFHLRAEGLAAGRALRCHVHLGDADLRATLQQALATRREATGVTLQFVDVFDSEARRLLVHDLPVDHQGVRENEARQVHLVILGFGRMGRKLAVRAAQLGRFANARPLKLSIIDRRAEANRAALLFRYPHFLDACDVEFHACEAESPEARALIEGWCADSRHITSIAVCFDNESRALEIAVQILPLLAAKRVRMALRMARQSGLAHLVTEAAAGSDLLRHVLAFGTEESFSRLEGVGDDTNEQFARAIHVAYKAKRRSAGEQDPAIQNELKRDPALQDWDDLPEDFRESSRQQADHLFIKLRSIGCEAVPEDDPRPAVGSFSAEEVELLARMEHDRWLAERMLAGWTWGPPPKDIARRTSPSLVSWGQLSDTIKDYDRNAARSIPDLLAGVGQKVSRRSGGARKG